MAVIYIVAKSGGNWRLYVKDTGTGYKRYTPGSKRQAMKDARQRAKKAAEASTIPESTLLIELAADRVVKEARVYGDETDVDARVERDAMTAGPYGVPVQVTFEYGPGADVTFRLATYMTKTEAQQNARRVRR